MPVGRSAGFSSLATSTIARLDRNREVNTFYVSHFCATIREAVSSFSWPDKCQASCYLIVSLGAFDCVSSAHGDILARIKTDRHGTGSDHCRRK